MKKLKKITRKASRFIYFKIPEDGTPEVPEWKGPEGDRDKALHKLRQLRNNNDDPNLVMCLQQLELLIEDELGYEIIEDFDLKSYFIVKFTWLDQATLLSEYIRAYSYLTTREDFDLDNADANDYFAGFVLCWLEISEQG